jgi:hypothetical protein
MTLLTLLDEPGIPPLPIATSAAAISISSSSQRYTQLLKDIQTEVPFITNRWKLDDVIDSTFITDDVSEFPMSVIGSPTFGRPGLNKQDTQTSALCGYATQRNHFEQALAAYPLGNGLTVEGITAKEPNGANFELFEMPKQFAVAIQGGSTISFYVWIGVTEHILTAAKVLMGHPQLVQCVYDPIAKLQAIWVDGTKVAEHALEGTVGSTITGNAKMLYANALTRTEAIGQDIAIYAGPLSQQQITEHFQAFKQILQDPAHSRTYPQIAVYL